MNDIADKYGFIAVYPSGHPSQNGKFHTWNALSCCGKAKNDNIDDVSFISHLVDTLGKSHNIDLRKVYVTGHSNGAMMSYLLACKLPHKITAIAW